MASIPQHVSATAQTQRQNFLTSTKQNRFKYRDYIPGVVPAPSLDPQMIPIILSDQPDYWPDAAWEAGFTDRKNTAVGAYFLPPHGAPATFNDYPSNQTGLPLAGSLPQIPSFANDLSFAAQRLCGANPMSIRRVVDLKDHDDKLAIDDSHIFDGLKLDYLVAEGRLYIVDYSHLATWAGPGAGTFDPLIGPGQKWLTAPIALFYWAGPFDSTGKFRPLGIQLRPVPSANVYTPLGSKQATHPNNWLMAKGAFQVADAHVHEWHSHLVRTHLTLAPFAISSERQLHDEHPVLVLLRPHLRYLLAINARTGELTDPDGTGTEILVPEHDELLELLVSDYRRYDFSIGGSLHRDLEDRNMQDAPIPYPYRDDGQPIDRATKKYIAEYLSLYYRNAAEIAGDPELQNFIKELRDSTGGKMGDELTLGGAGVANLKALTDLLSSVIWTSGPMHSAVNYAQWGYMADVRNQPTAGHMDVDLGPTTPLGFDPVVFLPTLAKAKKQSGLMYALGTHRMDMLGYYRPKDMLDEAAITVNSDYQCALARVGADTMRRDANRAFSYPYLLPWNITNSTSV